MVSTVGGIVIAIVVILVAAAIGWVVFSQLRARRLGVGFFPTLLLTSSCCFAFPMLGEASDVPTAHGSLRQHRKASSGATAERRQRSDEMTLANNGYFTASTSQLIVISTMA